MAYIGTSPSNGVRRVHTYTATANQTTFTGSSTEGVTLTYADTNYIDVFQNGVLLGSADYTSTSGTSVVLAQGASVSDLVVIVVYDVFSVADTVSKTSGGSFDSAVTMSGGLVVADGGNIGSASDTDAISINSSGVVTQSAKPRFHARRTGSAQSETDSSNADAVFNTKDFDIQMSYNTSNGQCTITHTGLYFIYTNITITRDDSDLRDAGIAILVNGSAKANTLERYATNDVGQTQLTLSALLSLSATDVVKVRVFANSVSGNNVNYVSHNMGGLNANSDFDTTGFCSFFGGYMIWPKQQN